VQGINARDQFNDLWKNRFELLALSPSVFGGDALAKFEGNAVERMAGEERPAPRS